LGFLCAIFTGQIPFLSSKYGNSVEALHGTPYETLLAILQHHFSHYKHHFWDTTHIFHQPQPNCSMITSNCWQFLAARYYWRLWAFPDYTNTGCGNA